jgi:hypothetical protein
MTIRTYGGSLPLTGGTLTGDLLFTDGLYDIGKNGATRPRNIFASGIIASAGANTASSYQANSSGFFAFASRGGITAPADGVLTLGNNAGTDFSRLQFGGTTSSFPALKRLNAQVAAVLADDSDYANFFALNHIAGTNKAIAAGGTTTYGFTATSTANFGVFFGSGAPTISAAKGSLYLRSDGSTTNDRAYINTNGSTTWTALTTAA